jgi:integrase
MKGCRALSDEEIARVREAFRGTYAARNRALFVLGVKPGFRISELLSLRVGDVWQAGEFLVRVAVPRRHMKGKREGRSVVLHPEAKAALAVWLMAMQAGPVGPETVLFPSRSSCPA